MKRLSPSVDIEDAVDGAKYETHTRARALLSKSCLLYTSPSPRDRHRSRMPSSA